LRPLPKDTQSKGQRGATGIIGSAIAWQCSLTVEHGDLELHLSQVGLRGKLSGFVSGVNDAVVDHDVELAGLSRLQFHRAPSASLDPSLHTEGFGLVASSGAVVNDARHDISFRKGSPPARL